MPTATPASPAAPTPRAQKATASSGHRHTPSTGQVRSGNGGTPKQLANGVRTSKVRGSAEAGEDRGRAERADLASRGKMPSKDGTAQRNAKEVEGLKDYVSYTYPYCAWLERRTVGLSQRMRPCGMNRCQTCFRQWTTSSCIAGQPML